MFELTIGDLLRRRAQRSAAHEALVDLASGRRWTFAELDREADRVAAALAAAGVAPGDRVALLARNDPAFVVTYLGVARHGAVLVPLNWRLTVPELAAIIDDAGATAVVFQAEVAELATSVHRVVGSRAIGWRQVGDADPPGFATDLLLAASERPAAGTVAGLAGADVRADDLLYLMYTSGTTGTPKGAMHDHATTVAAVVSTCAAMDYRPGDRYYNVLPLFHVASLQMVNLCLYRDCTMVLGQAFDPAETWEVVERERITAMMAVPTMLAAMAGTHDPVARDLSSLRVLSTGAAPVPLPLLERYQGLGIAVVQAYGMTETGGAISVLAPDDAADHVGSAGQTLLTLDLRVVDDKGRDRPPGEPGEIVVRGPVVTTGYWRRPEATAAAFRDGWFHTGDVGDLDEAGYLTIRDRLTDMVISGGENVYPAELEAVVGEHPGVVEVAVIGQPSPRWGESPCAVVVPADPQVDAADLLAWVGERVAGFKRPRRVEVVDALPRNAAGKVLKHELRRRFPGPAPE
jgi:O-succinylbenzoate-CoA ligase